MVERRIKVEDVGHSLASVPRPVERVVSAFEAGIVPWSRPKRLGFACGLPVNAKTGETYEGINTWLLELAAIERGFRSSRWATREEWNSLGKRVIDHRRTTVI